VYVDGKVVRWCSDEHYAESLASEYNTCVRVLAGLPDAAFDIAAHLIGRTIKAPAETLDRTFENAEGVPVTYEYDRESERAWLVVTPALLDDLLHATENEAHNDLDRFVGSGDAESEWADHDADRKGEARRNLEEQR
jgi:hypothetical protein